MAPGFELEDYEEETAPVEVWPENAQLFLLFRALSTQWLTTTVSGIAGGALIRLGLHYPSLYPLLDRISADQLEWQRNFELIQAMEAAALAVINKAAV